MPSPSESIWLCRSGIRHIKPMPSGNTPDYKCFFCDNPETTRYLMAGIIGFNQEENITRIIGSRPIIISHWCGTTSIIIASCCQHQEQLETLDQVIAQNSNILDAAIIQGFAEAA